MAVGGVDTRRVLVLALTGLERAILSRVRAVVRDADTIEDVLAEIGLVRASRGAYLEAECVRAHEAVCVC